MLEMEGRDNLGGTIVYRRLYLPAHLLGFLGHPGEWRVETTKVVI